MADRLLGRSECSECSARDAALRSAALNDYQGTLARLEAPGADLAALSGHLADLEGSTGLSADAALHERTAAVVVALRAAIADGDFTSDDEARLMGLADALGVHLGTVIGADAALLAEVQLAAVNAGRLVHVANPSIILKRGEIDYLEVEAELMKEVVDREMRGGYGGVSFRVAKGVRLNTGRIRAHSVVTGSHIEVADTGILVVTSLRVAFKGQRQALEVPHTRLLSLNAYNDGVGLVIANRAKVPVFRVANGALVVATINAAAAA
jgi:hypothetical protein